MDAHFGAVLTGDIIQSMKFDLEARRQIREDIGFITGMLAASENFKSCLPAPVQQFRGDGWQLPVLNPVLSLRIAVLIRAFLRIRSDGKKIDTRISIGVGDLPHGHSSTFLYDGEAYIISGRGLDDIPKRGGANLVVAVSASKEALQPFHAAINPMLNAVDYLIDHWSTHQAEAIVQALGEKASLEKLTRRTTGSDARVMRYALERGGWRVIKDILRYFESSLPAGD